VRQWEIQWGLSPHQWARGTWLGAPHYAVIRPGLSRAGVVGARGGCSCALWQLGSWAGQRPRVGDYVAVSGPRTEATVAGCR